MKRIAAVLRGKAVRTGGLIAFWVVVLVVLMLYLEGVFHAKVAPAPPVPPPGRSAAGVPLESVRFITVPRSASAVGSIRPVLEAAVASKVLEKVVEVNVRAGQSVAKDEVLVKLDDQMLRARLQQAQAAYDAAKAAKTQAQTDFDAITRAVQADVATKTELDRATTNLQGATAALDGADQALSQARTTLDYATILAPFDGTVIDKQVNVGDMVSPGQVLLTLYDPTRMQLVASVPESLAYRLTPGQDIAVSIDAIGKQCSGVVSEIVPQSQTASRSFIVKVTGPCQPGVYGGMFGRMLIPLGTEQVLVVPRSAVMKIGQLDMVDVDEGGTLRRRAIQLGENHDGLVAVLSGLTEGEKVAVRRAEAGANG